jgi:hypothetical protein
MSDDGLEERYKKFAADPKSEDLVFNHITNGGSLTELAEMIEIPYYVLMSWIDMDPARTEKHRLAQNRREEWCKETILSHLRWLATFDIGELCNPDGSLKKINEIPKRTRAAIAAIDVAEIFEFERGTKNKIGETKKIRSFDKLKALEIAGKQLGIIRDKVEHRVEHTLEDIVAESFKTGDEK